MSELIIKNALVVNGTGAEPFNADLRISFGRIRELGTLTPGPDCEVIDAQGLALCPGFVDVHGHSDYHLLSVPSGESKLLQGMTTEVGGNCGYSAAPIHGEILAERMKFLKDELKVEAKFHEVEEYFSALKTIGLGVNFALLVGYNTVRGNVIGYRRQGPDAKELKAIQAQIAKAMQAGCLGMSAGLIYAPGTFTTADELAEALAPVQEAGGIFTCHIRSEGDKLLEAIEEFILIGKKAKVRLELSHLKTGGPKNWGKLDRAFELIERAQKDGIEIMADRYPYTSSFTSLNAVLPDWVFEGGEPEYRRKLREEKLKIIAEMEQQYDPDYWERIMVSQCFSENGSDFEGKTVAELAKEKGIGPAAFVADFLEQEAVGPNAIFHSMSEANLERIFLKKWVMLGSDSGARGFTGVLAKGKPHPRVFGSFPRFFAKFMREKKMFGLAEAVKKCTSLGAEHFGIADRGKIAPGFYADLVLFDPEKISDQATFENPFQPPVGIEMVMVNGELAVSAGKLTGAPAGRVVRKKQ
jgi:N-acyl-D-amino-acid deacylase